MADETDGPKSEDGENSAGVEGGNNKPRPPRVAPTWGARQGADAAASKLRPPTAPGLGGPPRPAAALRPPGLIPPKSPSTANLPRTQLGVGADESSVPAKGKTLMYGSAPSAAATPAEVEPPAVSSAQPAEDAYTEIEDADAIAWDVEPGVLATSDAERTDVNQARAEAPRVSASRPPGSYSLRSTVERVRTRDAGPSVPPAGPVVASPAAASSSALEAAVVEAVAEESAQPVVLAPELGSPASRRPEAERHVVAATQTRADSMPPPSGTQNPLDQELKARADRLVREDPQGAAHAHVELGLLCEWVLGDRARAEKHYESARQIERALPSAASRLRRLLALTPESLTVLADEIALAETDAAKGALYATAARLHEARNDFAAAREAYEDSLRFAPRNAAALQGLEVVLRREYALEPKKFGAALAEHLQTWADACAPDGAGGDAILAAWLLVERAHILERTLADVPAARVALTRAVALAPNPGPVRGAMLRHLARNDRDGGLAEALRVEGEREGDAERTARLNYAAARILLDRNVARGDGVAALFRAESCVSSGSLTQERVFAELLRQLEQDNDFARIVDIRVKRLGLLSKREAIGFEYVRLADAYGRLGRADLAADASARALASDPTNRSVRESLDQSLQRMGRHAERVRMWLLAANSERPTRERLQSYLRASDIASRHLNQDDQAVDALRGAWMLSPGHGTTFDGLVGLLRPHRATAEIAKISEQRVDLYEQAAAVESDREHKLALLEKVLVLWEDELDRPDRAISVAERMLAIEPGRRSALIALARNARRAKDTDKLLFALGEEASRTSDVELRVRLLLEAAEVADYKNEIDKSLLLIDKALVARPNDIDGCRARVRALRKLNRHDDARKTLMSLVANDADAAFETLLEVADLDESFRKAPGDAVEAYRAAQRLRPAHPLPTLSLVRLLRQTRNHKRLVTELKSMAREEAEPRALAQLHMMAAEVEEHCLGDDEAALRSLAACDEALQAAPEPAWDSTVFESTERILFRLGDDAGLMRLYAKWLERKPPAAIDHTLRVGLAFALEETSPAQASEVLDALVTVVPKHVPALRRLVHLRRTLGEAGPLSNLLFAQGSVLGARVARAGALWEVVNLEERVGPAHTLEALSRIIREDPADVGALDALIRVASRLVNNVSVPHPALLAARGQLLAALRARRELTIDPISRAAYHIEEATLLEFAEVDRDPARALEGYREALLLWPTSTLAARGLERLGSELADHRAVVQSQLALAKLTPKAEEKAALYVRAADLTSAQLRDDLAALELFELALDTDPENRDAAHALNAMLVNEPRRLIERFRDSFDRMSVPAQVAFVGAELAQAYLRIHRSEGDAARLDYGPAISAIRRAMDAKGEELGSLFVLSGLYNAQKAWGESRETLQRIVELSQNSEKKERLTALFALVDLFEGPLADTALAEATLVNILKQDATHKLALERLHALAVRTGDKALARSSLERLAECETDLAQRTEYQLRVAEVCREANDGAGMLRALSDAVVSTPNDVRPFTVLTRLYRAETHDGALGLAHALEQILEMAKARRRPLEARWLYTLGLLELNLLKRINEGLAHLQTAIGAASVVQPTLGQSSPLVELRAALGLGLLSAGRTKDAVLVLRELLTTDSDTLVRLLEPSAFNTVRSACVAATGSILSAVLACLDAALATDGRADEKLPVEELRALLGEVSGERLAKLRTRRLEPDAPFANALGPKELSGFLFSEARTPFIEVAVAIQAIVPKVLGFTLSSFGIASRDRVNARDGHPSRVLLDRVARAFGVSEYEFYLSANWTGPARVIAGDPPAIVASASIAELPEGEQVFTFARLVARIALGLTFIDDVPPEGVDGLLTSAMRSIFPQWGLGELSPQREHSLAASLAPMQRAIGRVQRKLLQERAQGISAALNPQGFVSAVRRSELRVAYALSGDLLGGIEVLRWVEPELARTGDTARFLLGHPVANELIRFALTQDAYVERRKLGVVWGSAQG